MSGLKPSQFIFMTLSSSLAIALVAPYWCSEGFGNFAFGLRNDFKLENLDSLTKMIEEKSGFEEACTDKLMQWKSENCTVLTDPAKTDIIVIGDSHANSLFPMIQDYVQTTKAANGILMSNNGLLPLLPHNAQGYFEFKDFLSNYLKSRANRTSVILVARWTHYLGLRGVHRGLKDKNISNSEECCTNALDGKELYEGSLRIIKSSLEDTLQQMTAGGIFRILIPLPYPEFRYDIKKCLGHLSLEECAVNRVQLLEYQGDVVKIIRQTVSHFSNVRLIEPDQYFCRANDCPQVISTEDGPIPVVNDDNHPSAAAARYLGKKIVDDLNWLAGVN
jgi:hypothetical protein